jgi:hypothetical protein
MERHRVEARELVARLDPRLVARLIEARPLRYADGPSEREDRPANVRAGSALRFVGARLAVVQDDVGFLALVREDGEAEAIALPRGGGGRRRFESRLGNKAEKLDLEAAITLPGPDGERLVAFGSGSTAKRERLVVFGPGGAVEIVHARRLYDMLRSYPSFAGAELNVEGAAIAGGRLHLFQRANGALAKRSAVVTLDLEGFAAFLEGRGDVPAPLAIRRYDLGAAGGVRYGFTDAATLPDGRLVFAAGAEDSPNTYDDGAVLGARLGVLDDHEARCADLVDADGRPIALKVEGIAPKPGRDDELYGVTDQDDPDAPSLLCTIRLEGPW